MLQAWISSPRGSLYFAAEATRYNLEHLRAHVRALCSGIAQSCLTVNLGAGDDRVAVAETAGFAQELTREGIQVRVSATIDAGAERALRPLAGNGC